MRDKERYNKYHRQYQLRRYRTRRLSAINALGGRCQKCKSESNLEIDHINPKNKTIAINRLWSISLDAYLEELKKCQILCHKCHVEKSIAEGSLRGGYNKVVSYNHGTGYMYYNDMCKCQKCREWRRLYRKKLVHYNGKLRET